MVSPTVQSHASNSTSRAGSVAAASVNRKKKNRANDSPDAAQIDYLTTELNYAHTKIVSQDNTITDLEHKIKILEEALNRSEEKLNSDLHRKYFSKSNFMGTSCCNQHLSPHSQTTCSSSRVCCMPTPAPGCCTSRSPCPPVPSSTLNCSIPSSHGNTGSETHINEIYTVAQVQAMQKDLEKLVSEVGIVRVDILQMKIKLKSLTQSQQGPGLEQIIESSTTPQSSETVTLADVHEPGEVDPSQFENAATDEFVPESNDTELISETGDFTFQDNSLNLNCNPQTIQLD